ncbi:MAG: hypothetical protein AB8B55_05530 [Mariniblastus sp.]
MKPDYGRTTITVPFELKKRMKKLRGQVNWSAVACEAFELKLEELGPVEEIETIEDALKRMKTLNEHASPVPDETGKSAGKHWAMNHAMPEELKRIEDYKSSMDERQWQDLMCSREGARELAILIDPRAGMQFPPQEDHLQGPGAHGPDSPSPNRKRSRRRGPGGRQGQGGGGRKRHGFYGPMEVWRSILDSRPEHPSFFLGFAEGALEVWDKLKDQF